MRPNGCVEGIAFTASTSFIAPSTVIPDDIASVASSSGASEKCREERVEIAAGPPLYDVFLGGSCGTTVWRREVVIPYLKKRSISYYDPQRSEWCENMIYEESTAKENSSLFLFVLDPATVNATSCLEIAYFAARKAPKLVVVFLGRAEWSDKAHPLDLPDRLRTCDLLDAILSKHSVPMLNSVDEALNYIDEVVIGEKSWREALANPMQRLPYLSMKTKRVVRNAASQLRSLWDQLRSGVRRYGGQVGSLLAAEVLVLLVFYVYFPSFPIAFLVVPILIFDYVAAIGSFVFYRYKDKWKKAKSARRVIIPSPPVPRMGMTAVNGTTPSAERKHLTKTKNGVTTSKFVFYDATQSLNKEVCEHFLQQQLLRPGLGTGLSRARKAAELAAKTSKGMRYCKSRCGNIYVGYDVFLSCSSSTETDWITQRAVPQLHKSGLTYTSASMCDKGMEDPLLHTASHILYYIPSYKTFLSGIIQIAYFLGHSDWQVTVCVPTEAEALELPPGDLTDALRVAVDRRNESYRIAFRYLKDMAQRRQSRVFSRIEDAIKHIASQTRRSFDAVADPFFLTRDDCRCGVEDGVAATHSVDAVASAASS
ncbi:hypothetical protein QR680_017343 [Steinernema hermaphroditum]|uniref:Uncharacterized protein n=1 Tax=Steinernema hermaphroditum TaxID=289476 RepID=A0AA39HGD9_9BILA|nr:hypothetical protein QR680_017343 [Steinernema hermaphroditum]